MKFIIQMHVKKKQPILVRVCRSIKPFFFFTWKFDNRLKQTLTKLTFLLLADTEPTTIDWFISNWEACSLPSALRLTYSQVFHTWLVCSLDHKHKGKGMWFDCGEECCVTQTIWWSRRLQLTKGFWVILYFVGQCVLFVSFFFLLYGIPYYFQEACVFPLGPR